MYLSATFFTHCRRHSLPAGLLLSFALTGCSFGTRAYIPPYPGRYSVPDIYKERPSEPVSHPSIPPEQGMLRENFSPLEQDAFISKVLKPSLAKISGRIAAYEQKLRAWQDLKHSENARNFSSEQQESLLTCRPDQIAGLRWHGHVLTPVDPGLTHQS